MQRFTLFTAALIAASMPSIVNAGCGQRSCTTTPIYRTGTEGPDIMFGYGGDDWFDGRGGDDEITSGSGADTVYGGDGNDVIHAGNGFDYVDAGPGADYVSTSSIEADVFLRAGDDQADASGTIYGGKATIISGGSVSSMAAMGTIPSPPVEVMMT